MKTLILMLQLLPSIIQAVKAAEEFVPLPAQGRAKLDLVLGVISDAYDGAAAIIPQITKVIGRIVEVANSTGIFKKS